MRTVHLKKKLTISIRHYEQAKVKTCSIIRRSTQQRRLDILCKVNTT